jgi:hypothetical protein
VDFQSFMATQSNDDHDHLADLEAKVQMSGVTGENSSTPVLAAGRPGLRFFADFGPAYAKLTGTDHDYQNHIVNRYNEQGDINYARLRVDAERYTHIQDQVDDTLNSVRNNGNSVFGSWQGTAADSANARFDTFIDQGRQTLTQFGMLADTITAVVDAVDRICFEKAAAVKSLTADRIGPCDKSDVSFLVDFAGRCSAGDFSDDELTRAANLCGVDINPALCRMAPQIFEKVAEDVNGWLTTVFVPCYEARLAKFDAACAATKDVVGLAWDGLREALSQVSADYFNTPTSTSTARSTAATQPLPDGHIAGRAGDGTPIATATPVGPAALAEAGRDDRTDESTGQSELMAPSAAGVGVVQPPVPTAVPATAPVAPAVGGGYGGYGFYGGFPAAGGAGGGDRERSRSLPIAGEQVFTEQGDQTRDADTGLVIGGDADTAIYNDEGAAEPEQDPPAAEPDDEEDLW